MTKGLKEYGINKKVCSRQSPVRSTQCELRLTTKRGIVRKKVGLTNRDCETGRLWEESAFAKATADERDFKTE